MDWQELNPERYKLLTGAKKLLALNSNTAKRAYPQIRCTTLWKVSLHTQRCIFHRCDQKLATKNVPQQPFLLPPYDCKACLPGFMILSSHDH